jgi:CubicO group peptidase (beta-lactamase class C family)
MSLVRNLAALLLAALLAGCQMVITPEPPDARASAAAQAEATSQAEEANPASAPASDEALYSDPDGRYTVPIPTNWTAESAGGYVALSSPQEQIQVFILVLPGDDLEAAVAEAWTTVDSSFALEPSQVLELPAGGGIERAVSVDYDTGSPPSEIVAAIAQLHEGQIYVLLFRGELGAVQQRAAQLGIIQSGFTIAGLDVVDLSGVEPLALDDAMLAEFERYIADALARFDVPGAAVAVVQDGEIVYAHGFGVRELGSDEPVTPETLMMIGSTGKTMTTMMMATLVDDGLMAWDTPVQEVLPQFAVADPELSRQITMRNLVCACTGVPRRDLEILFNVDTLTAEEIVESLSTFEFFTEFGEAFQYSNQLVAVGGYAAAAAAGAEWGNLYDAYVQEMEERIFAPIGMESTTFSFGVVTASDNYAQPHGLDVDAGYRVLPLRYERFVTPIAPAGAPWSTVLDMGNYLITELNSGVSPDGTRVVSAENLAVTFQPQVPVSAEASYGLGWIVDEYKGLPMLQHGGNTLGFTSDLVFLPQAGIGISVLTNAQTTNAFSEAVRYRLLELLFAQEPEADAGAIFAFETLRNEFSKAFADVTEIDPAQVEPY